MGKNKNLKKIHDAMLSDDDSLIYHYGEYVNELTRLQGVRTWSLRQEKIKRNPSLFLDLSRLEAMLKKWIKEESRYDSDWPLEENELLPFGLFVELHFKENLQQKRKLSKKCSNLLKYKDDFEGKYKLKTWITRNTTTKEIELFVSNPTFPYSRCKFEVIKDRKNKCGVDIRK